MFNRVAIGAKRQTFVVLSEARGSSTCYFEHVGRGKWDRPWTIVLE